MAKSTRVENWAAFLGLMLPVIAVSALWLSTVELVDANIILPVRHSVQFAYPFLLLVMVARPLQQMLRQPWTAALLRRRRIIGVAFAGAMTAHLILIAFRFWYTPELSYPTGNLIVGGGAYALLYLMVITSFDGPKRALGPKRWKILHRTGLIYAALIFGVPRSLQELSEFEYLKLGVPMLLVVLIRLAAWQQSRRQDNRRSRA